MSRALRRNRDYNLQLSMAVSRLSGEIRGCRRAQSCGFYPSEIAHMPAGWAPLARDGKYDEAEHKYYQTHQFESQYVHGQLPQNKSQDLSGAIDRRLICASGWAPPGLMLSAGLTIYVPQNVRSTR